MASNFSYLLSSPKINLDEDTFFGLTPSPNDITEDRDPMEGLLY
jgi:hypothetical protein